MWTNTLSHYLLITLLVSTYTQANASHGPSSVNTQDSTTVSIENLWQEALFIEQIQGDLNHANGLYGLIVEVSNNDDDVANALLRLAENHHQLGNTKQAQLAFNRLLADYNHIEHISQRLSSNNTIGYFDLDKLLPPPWQNNEKLFYEKLNSKGFPLSYYVYTKYAQTTGGHTQWVSMKDWVSKSSQARMTKSHFQEYQNRPIKEQKYYWYGPVVKLHIDDENTLHYSNISTDHSFSFNYEAPALSRTDDLSLLRRLPLTLGFNTKVKVFLSGLAGFKDLEIIVDDTKHSVETKAGVFDCFKITLSINDEGSQITKNEVWISDSPERYPVKLKWSKLSTKLTQISDDNYQTTIKTEATKLTMPLPKAWAGFDVTKRPDRGNSYAIRSPDGLTEAVLFHELKPDEYWQNFDIYKIKDEIVEWNNKIYAEYVVRPNSYEERAISGFKSLRFKADYLSLSKKKYVSDRMIIAKEPYLIKILTRQLAKNEALYQDERDAIFGELSFE